MKTLVIIPSLILKYTFSAPLAWLFSKHIDQVTGIYSFDLTPECVQDYDLFIIDLNWYIALYETLLIVRFLKKYNPNAKILIGGLFAQLKYEDIFQISDIDYFIKGDNELPIAMLLEGVDPKRIPNLVGRSFNNETTFSFHQSDYDNIEFSLEWFPDYLKYWKNVPEGKDPCTSYEVPIPPHGRYHLPAVITSKGGCTGQHSACAQCLGSRKAVLESIYKREPIVVSNEILIRLLHKISGQYDQASIIHTGHLNYDLRGNYFDIDCTIEIDTMSCMSLVSNMAPAFRKATFHLSLYEDGFAGGRIKTMKDIEACIDFEDENHRVHFWGERKHLELLKIPEKNRLDFGDYYPRWLQYDYYNNFDNALKTSKRWHQFTRTYNLYPTKIRPSIMVRNYAWLLKAFSMWRLGIIPLNRMLEV